MLKVIPIPVAFENGGVVTSIWMFTKKDADEIGNAEADQQFAGSPPGWCLNLNCNE